MNGLFRRLAQEMVGAPPPRARAMSRLPFVTPLEPRLDDAVELPAPDRPTGRVEPDPAPILPLVGADAPDAPGGAVADVAKPPTARAAAAAPATAMSQVSAKTHEASGPVEDDAVTASRPGITDGGSRKAAEENPGASDLPMPMFPPSPVPSAERRCQPHLTTVETTREAGSPITAAFDSGDRGVRSIVPGDRTSSVDISAAPPPLMTSIPPNSPVPGSSWPLGSDGPAPLPSQSQAGVDSAAPSSGAPEVHVHIGRVEVTAAQESAPPPRRARRGRQPMSLDEYLSKRRRGAS